MSRWLRIFHYWLLTCLLSFNSFLQLPGEFLMTSWPIVWRLKPRLQGDLHTTVTGNTWKSQLQYYSPTWRISFYHCPLRSPLSAAGGPLSLTTAQHQPTWTSSSSETSCVYLHEAGAAGESSGAFASRVPASGNFPREKDKEAALCVYGDT